MREKWKTAEREALASENFVCRDFSNVKMPPLLIFPIPRGKSRLELGGKHKNKGTAKYWLLLITTL